MEKHGKVLAPILCAILPLIPLSYLYARNAEYVSAAHVALVGCAMAALSLMGYLLLRLAFRARFPALLGCLTLWVMFFSLKSASAWAVVERKLIGYGMFLVLYAAAAVLLSLLVAFAARKVRAERLYPFLTIFFGVLLAVNAFPAVTIGIADARDAGSVQASAFRTQFSVSQRAPSPNVYWFHCDGMLGFDAFEKYFGDDQAEFSRALAERGFQINRAAMLEADHTTSIAVPALLCPDYYDAVLQNVLKDHETAEALSPTLSKGDLRYARLKNETRLAFEQKGYLSQTIGSINIYYPPVAGRVYVSGDSSGAYTLETGGDFENQYLSIIEAGELAILLTGVPGNAYFNTVVKLGERGLLGFPLSRGELKNTLGEERLRALAGDNNLLLRDRMFLQSINDATYAGQPAFSSIFYIGAHHPFTMDEKGRPQSGDPGDIHAYAGQHRYAASMLIAMIDQILSRDPDAVIVLQADHGLHGQSKAQITAAFGEDAVIPIWNQVMSALRVPEKFKTGEEAYALKNPLNMSRYLVNSFVGKTYAYVE